MAVAAQKIQPRQIKLIHIAKKDLNLSELQYRDMLGGFGAMSCKDLCKDEADDLLKLFQKLGFKIRVKGNYMQNSHAFGKKKFEELAGRSEDYPAPSQLRKIEVLWRINSRQKDDESLSNFMKRITGTKNITALKHNDAVKLIKAIKSLKGGR